MNHPQPMISSDEQGRVSVQSLMKIVFFSGLALTWDMIATGRSVTPREVSTNLKDFRFVTAALAASLEHWRMILGLASVALNRSALVLDNMLAIEK